MPNFGEESMLAPHLSEGRVLYGLWAALGSAYSTEVCATTGFDWILIDAEHGPNDVRSILEQLRALAPYPVLVVVRPPNLEPSLLKRYLDIGATNILAPMVNTAEAAAAVVSATQYPPKGIRGVGAGLARVSRWNGRTDYLKVADKEVNVIVQIETIEALINLESICRVDGIAGVFFGPADIAASMGKLGQPTDPEVVEKIIEGAKLAKQLKVPSGIFTVDPKFLSASIAAGVQLLGVASDVGLLAAGGRAAADAVRKKFT